MFFSENCVGPPPSPATVPPTAIPHQGARAKLQLELQQKDEALQHQDAEQEQKEAELQQKGSRLLDAQTQLQQMQEELDALKGVRQALEEETVRKEEQVQETLRRCGHSQKSVFL